MKKFLHKVLTVVFAVSMFLGIQAFGNSNGFQASADDTVISPQGIYYKGTPDEAKLGNQASNYADSKNPLKSLAENIKEKLNLDEPIPESTKEFLGSTKKRVEKAVAPITGTK